jgi:hypothetical protein
MATPRSKLPSSAFVYPKARKYPINTVGRARNALARASSTRNAGSYRTVAKAVRARYGNKVATVGTKRGNLTTPGLRGRSR